MISPYMQGLPELLLFGAAILALALGAFPLKAGTRRYCTLAFLAAPLAGAVWSGWYLAGNPVVNDNMFAVLARDGFSSVVKTAVLAAAFLAVLVMDGAEDNEQFGAEHSFLVISSTLGAVLMAGSTNLLMLFVAIELTSLPLYVMTSFRKALPEPGEAGFKYYVLGVLATGFLVFGASLIYGFTGSLDLAGIVSSARSAGLAPAFGMGIVFLLAGLGFKVAAVPFHSWAPDVYEAAPSPVLAYLTSAPKIAGFAVMLRFLTSGLSAATDQWALTGMVLAVASMTLGNLVAMPQRSLRRMLAYSSIAHAGYMLVGVASGTPQAVRGVLFYVVLYAVTNIGLFSLISALERSGLGDELSDFSGLVKRSPAATMVLSVMLFSLAGLPPLAGFWAKFSVFYAAVAQGYYAVVVIAVLNSAASLFYYANILRLAFFNEPMDRSRLERPGLPAAIASVVAVFLVFIGLYPQPLYGFIALARMAVG